MKEPKEQPPLIEYSTTLIEKKRKEKKINNKEMMRKQKYKDESHLLSVLWSLDPNAGYKGCMQYRSSHHWPPATNNTTHLYMSPSESNEEI